MTAIALPRPKQLWTPSMLLAKKPVWRDGKPLWVGASGKKPAWASDPCKCCKEVGDPCFCPEENQWGCGDIPWASLGVAKTKDFTEGGNCEFTLTANLSPPDGVTILDWCYIWSPWGGSCFGHGQASVEVDAPYHMLCIRATLYVVYETDANCPGGSVVCQGRKEVCTRCCECFPCNLEPCWEESPCDCCFLDAPDLPDFISVEVDGVSGNGCDCDSILSAVLPYSPGSWGQPMATNPADCSTVTITMFHNYHLSINPLPTCGEHTSHCSHLRADIRVSLQDCFVWLAFEISGVSCSIFTPRTVGNSFGETGHFCGSATVEGKLASTPQSAICADHCTSFTATIEW